MSTRKSMLATTSKNIVGVDTVKNSEKTHVGWIQINPEWKHATQDEIQDYAHNGYH